MVDLSRSLSALAFASVIAGCNAILGNEEATLGDPAASTPGGAGGAGASGGQGGLVECEEAEDCPGAESACQTRVCADGACGFAFAMAGTPVADDPGNCLGVICDGAGATALSPDAADVPDDDNDCTIDACTETGPVSTFEASGAPCDGGAGVCDDGGSCVECNVDEDCPDPEDVCHEHECVPLGCTDGALTPAVGETDVDCGGPRCVSCGDGLTCVEGSDCQSGHCQDNACVAPTCDDAIENGLETDVDCGGGCDPCPFASGCAQHTDCIGGVCAGGLCAASCSDGVENGQETGVDCGGPGCSAGCGLGETCFAADDCESGYCFTGASVCDPAHCGDGAKSGDETDADCGGSACTRRCAVGDDCKKGSDCASGICGALSKTCGIL